jgi:tetratricopeptide (TPR) repeat protein
MTISIRIKLTDLILDPAHDLDLTALPLDEAADLIQQAFGFLASSVEVSVGDGEATITAPGTTSQQRDEAQRLLSQGVKSAQQGKYRQAIRSFEEALELAPDHVEARRNLGLAYLELGNSDQAKAYVTEAIRLDPHDAWSFLLLGNIAWKQERDYDLAIRYYQKAYENKPDDPYLLNNYGAVLAEHQQYAEAEIFLRRAMAAQPDYPNPYLALAVLHLNQNQGQAALQALDELFAAPRSQDIRSRPVYEEAQRHNGPAAVIDHIAVSVPEALRAQTIEQIVIIDASREVFNDNVNPGLMLFGVAVEYDQSTPTP